MAISVGGLLLGVINIAIVVAALILIGLFVMWFATWMDKAIPANIQKVYMAIVFLIGLYMIVALVLGLPSVRIV